MLNKNWGLIKYLVLREVKTRYKQSFLGFFWVLLNPFFQMLIMSFVFFNVIRTQDTGIPYPLFIYTGLLPWLFFANSLTNAMGALENNSALIKKIYFPREILIFSTLIAKVFDLLMASLIFIVLLLVFKVKFSLFMFLFIPIFLIQFLFTFGLALFLSAINLFYKDIQYLFNLILTLWFYLTPILYAVEYFPERYRFIFKLNPMSVFINAYRQVLFGTNMPNFSSLGIGIVAALVIFILSYKAFKKLEGTFADIV